MKFKNKIDSSIVDAIQFTDESKEKCFNFVTCKKEAGFDFDGCDHPKDGKPVLRIIEDPFFYTVKFNDWIIKHSDDGGVLGSFSVATNGYFKTNYKKIEE